MTIPNPKLVAPARPIVLGLDANVSRMVPAVHKVANAKDVKMNLIYYLKFFFLKRKASGQMRVS